MLIEAGYPDREIWLKYFNKLDSNYQEIFCHPEYSRVFELQKLGRAACYIYEEGDEFLLYPFLKSIVADRSNTNDIRYYDIQGAHGYNGAYGNSKNAVFLDKFHKSIIQHCRDSGIVAEFTRFNPVLQNQILSGYLNISTVNRNIIVSLEDEDLWNNAYEYSTRKNIRKAMRSGLKSMVLTGDDITDKWIGDFYEIYAHTMHRNKVEQINFFDRSLFEELVRRLPQYLLFCFILGEDSAPVSAELVLYGKQTGYSYLGGTLSEYYPLRPGDLLKHTLINHMKSMGLKYFCLGGGQQPGDGIYRFKKSFSKNGEIDFNIGTHIHNKSVYESLIRNWEIRNQDNMETYKNHFLKYRF